MNLIWEREWDNRKTITLQVYSLCQGDLQSWYAVNKQICWWQSHTRIQFLHTSCSRMKENWNSSIQFFMQSTWWAVVTIFKILLTSDRRVESQQVNLQLSTIFLTSVVTTSISKSIFKSKRRKHFYAYTFYSTKTPCIVFMSLFF